MTDAPTIADYVGISTNVMTGVDIWEAADLTKKYGLTCFEIHHGDFEAAVGDPWMIPHAGVWPRTFSADDRKRLRDRLSHIKNLTVHGSPTDLNISALNPAIREESQRQYREMLELGIDLGAGWVTYHRGHPSLSVVPKSWCYERNCEFVESILPLAREHGVKIALEVFDTDYLERFDDENFGILLDIGHAVAWGNRFAPEGRGDTRTILDWIDHLGDRLIEMHIHNVINWAENPGGGTAHRSFEYGLCIQLEPIVRKLKDKGLLIPMVSEIYEPTAEEAVATVARTRDNIVRYWQG